MVILYVAVAIFPSAPFAVTVIVKVPCGVVEEVLIVRVSFTPEIESVIGLEDQDTVTPEGSPLTVSVTNCGDPLMVADVVIDLP